MKILVAITLGCSIYLLVTGSFLTGGLLLALVVAIGLAGNRSRKPKDPAAPRDRAGGLDGLFGGG
ncbi:hypothetical protein [Rhodococcus zopfii]|uniref:hypothetical protein n=1 Tax=Rhodococcus zopfii TaxID=43772 RepID=UPI003528FEC6